LKPDFFFQNLNVYFVTQRGHADWGVATPVGVVDHGVEALVEPLPEHDLTLKEKTLLSGPASTTRSSKDLTR